MDLGTSARPRSSRSHHGTLKVRRQASPDSACEQASGPDDPSEEGGGGEMRWRTTRRSVTMRPKGPAEDRVLLKGVACQDSDVDSGIVACRKPGQRIGSTSSADTDSSQESRRKVEYSPPAQKSELPIKSRGINGTQRCIKYSSVLNGGPVIGDHSVLKECNRRPPTPLSVFPESHHCVRFDDQLQLSEENIRRSCRKLFATLYAQRFSYPSNQNSYRQQYSRDQDSSRFRSRTVPELELRRHSPGHSSVRSNKENLSKDTPVQGRRASLGWIGNKNQIALSSHKSNSDLNLSTKVAPSPLSLRDSFQVQNTHPMDQRDLHPCRTSSTDSGLGNFKTGQCTCHGRLSSQYRSSQPSGSYNCNCVCNCSKSLPRSMQRSQQGMVKSNSCSTLSAMLSKSSSRTLKKSSSSEGSTSRRSKSLQKTSSCSNLMEKAIPEYCPTKNARRTSLQVQSKSDECLVQKTSSCSNLVDKTSNYHVTNVYNDSMIHAYARMASVVPEELKSANSTLQRPRVLGRSSYRTENIYDTIHSTYTSSPSRLSNADKVHLQNGDVCSNKQRPLKSDVPEQAVNQTKVDTGIKFLPSAEIYSQIASNAYGSFALNSYRQSVQNRTIAAQRPKSVGVVNPSCSPVHVYLKPALKKSTQSHNEVKAASQASIGGETTEVEYAVVDKSKKNRFTSLPALNRYNSNTCMTDEMDDKEHPPVPPKKMLNKSEFSLFRSRSTSPKKSFMERMQTLSRSAKNVLQKAFSTERIYRPEREERMEASGEKSLQRSRSFIKTLTSSFRRKKRRRNLVAEVVPQASSDPQWDEVHQGTNNLVHVRGQLLQLNLDGSQVVELTKPHSKPYGFFVARGRVRNSKGIFVSRMRDEETQKQLAGLLDIGDEILEIDGANVKNSEIMEVNNLMANKNTLLLTVLPYICRKDI